MLGAGRSKVDYVLEVTRCDDFELADYYGCEGSRPQGEGIYFGVLQVGAEEKPAYYQSTECSGSELPNLKVPASPATEEETQPPKQEDLGDST